jgi:hypothetical protein
MESNNTPLEKNVEDNDLIDESYDAITHDKDNILCQLRDAFGNTLRKQDLKLKVYDHNASLRNIEFIKALKILSEYGFISIGNEHVNLTSKGLLLFEFANNSEPSQPYTKFIEGEVSKAEKTLSLLDYQIKYTKEQIELNPLIEQANKSTIETNRRIVLANYILIGVFALTAIFSAISACMSYKSYQLEQKKYLIDSQVKAQQSNVKIIKNP